VRLAIRPKAVRVRAETEDGLRARIAHCDDGVLTVTSTLEETKFTFVMPLR
jgi:hypothetical protein